MSFYFVCAKVNVQDHLNNSTLKSMHGLKYVLNLDWIRTPEFVMKTTDSVYLNVPLLSRMIFDSPNYRYYSFTCHTRLRDNQGVCAQRKITSYQSKLNSLVSFLGTHTKKRPNCYPTSRENYKILKLMQAAIIGFLDEVRQKFEIEAKNICNGLIEEISHIS